MLQLYNLDKVKIRGLKSYKDYKVESELSSGDKTLSFLYPSHLCKEVIEECYIRTEKDEFIVKEISNLGEYKSIVAILNIEDLQGKVFEEFETVNKNITESLNLALAGTGWTVGRCDVTRRRTVRKTNSSSWDIVKEAKKRYRVELEFDSLNNKINIFEKRGSDKGVYFLENLNLMDLDIQGNSYEFYTRIIAIGKDDIRVTLENFQYSKKVKTFIWKDERYTDIDSLREDAQAKLNEISKPYRAYAVDIIDLSVTSEKHKILSYKLGDTVTLVSKSKWIREKQRISKIIEYPDESERNACEVSNITRNFEDIQKDFQDTTDTVNNITKDDGHIDESTINGLSTKQIYDFESSVGKITDLTVVNAKIENLYAEKASIGELNAVIANIGELNATKANITELNAVKATITNLEATTAKITDLTAINAKITVLEVDTASIRNLLAGNITGENIQAGGITSDKLTIQNAFITNAMIENVDLNKLNAGDISTTKFRIKSDDGGIEIVGATQQFKDKNNKVRIQMGKDSKGDFDIYILDETGNILFNTRGITENAIADDLIVKDMISSDAVGEKQIDYSSFSTGFNKDTNTSTIKGTKIKLDNQNQTLDIAFNQLKTQADGTKTLTESNSTTIGIQQGQINTAINNTQIVKDGQTILLKDDYNRTVQTVDGMKSTIAQHTSLINEATGKVESMETKVNTVERDLSGTKSTVSANSSKIDGLNSTVSSQGTSITQLLNKIELKVEASDISTAKGQAISESNNYTVSKVSEAKASIKLETDRITQNVSSVDNKVISLDGKVVAVDNRLKTAESKITDSAIISTVQATINTAKTEAINSANGNTTNQLKNYSTTSNMNTAITQSANSVKTEISKTYVTSANANSTYATKTALNVVDGRVDIAFTSKGGSNILWNTDYKDGINQFIKTSYQNNGVAHNVGISNNQHSMFRDSLYVSVPTRLNGGWVGCYQIFDCKVGQLYTFSCLANAHRCNGRITILTTSGNALPGVDGVTVNYNGEGANFEDWKRVIITFTATATTHRVNFAINSTSGDNGHLWIIEPQVVQGNFLGAWTPNPNEGYNASTVFNRDGMTVNNGAITIKNNSGITVLNGDSSGNLMLTGYITGVDQQIKLIGDTCKIDGRNNRLRFQYDKYNYLQMGDNICRLYSRNENSTGVAAPNLFVATDGNFNLSCTGTRIKMLRSSAEIQCRTEGDTAYGRMSATGFNVASKREFKEDIHIPSEVDFISILRNSEIKAYNYKSEVQQCKGKSIKKDRHSSYVDLVADKKLGFILDDLTEEAVEVLHPYGTEGIDLYSMTSILWKVCQEQQLRIEELKQKVQQLQLA